MVSSIFDAKCRILVDSQNDPPSKKKKKDLGGPHTPTPTPHLLRSRHPFPGSSLPPPPEQARRQRLFEPAYAALAARAEADGPPDCAALLMRAAQYARRRHTWGCGEGGRWMVYRVPPPRPFFRTQRPEEQKNCADTLLQPQKWCRHISGSGSVKPLGMVRVVCVCAWGWAVSLALHHRRQK